MITRTVSERRKFVRELGHAGQKEIVMTESFEITRGHKTVRVVVKPGKPLRLISTLNTLCGRMKEKAG